MPRELGVSIGCCDRTVTLPWVLDKAVDIEMVKEAMRDPRGLSALEVGWLLDDALAAIEQLEKRVYDSDYETEW